MIRGHPNLTRVVKSAIGLLIVLLILITFPGSAFSVGDENAFPIASIESDGQFAQVPDWSEITLRSLPPVTEDGEFNAPNEVKQALGYDLSRRWKAGQTADTFLKLGDLQTSLYPQISNLDKVAQLTQLDLNQVALSAFGLVENQSIADLLSAIPGLETYRLSDLAPIHTLLRAIAGFNSDANLSLGAIVAANPNLGELKLGQLDKKMETFAIADLPGLANTPLQNFKNWENTLISQVPGLANVPLAQMPNPIQTVGSLGVVDVVYGTAEENRQDAISGSHEAGFTVPCRENCAHAELTGPTALHGKQWISGKFQQVKGGFGVLGAVHGGQEPTGRHPFGDAFKVSVWDVDESSGRVSTALHFRICKRGLPDLGCTPYFLGPVPFLSYHEKDPIFVGVLDAQGGASSQASIPAGVIERAMAKGIPAQALPGGESVGSFGDGTLCGEGVGSVEFQALASAFSGIEGNYGSAGSFVCDGDGNCGRGLGRYQYMSYRSDVRVAVERQEEGAAFLAKVDSGASISEGEISRYFPPAVQDQIFKADQTQNIQQAVREGFRGDRLIERVGQIHFGGPEAPIDGGASDQHGRLTLKTYGEELRRNYQAAAKSKSGSKCQKAKGGKPK